MRKMLLLTCLGLCLGAILEQPAVADEASPWKVVVGKGDKLWQAIRINTATGQSWMAADGHWQPIPEVGSAPAADAPGTYGCQVFYVGEDWEAVRLNVRSGESWLLQGGKWNSFVVDAP